MSLPLVECIHVTEGCIREWKSGNPGFKPPNPVPSLRFLYELCWTMVRGEFPIQRCKAALESVEFSDRVSYEDIGSNFADIVAQMAQDLTMPGEYRARLIKLAKWLVESSMVPLRLFQERCEEEFLWESEMIKIRAADLKSKEVRVNTRLLYQQTKFNLLREESEGYAKLVTLLCQGSETRSENASGAIVGIIKVLECFELQPDNNVFLDLIPIFPKSHASEILGFKFQYYQRMEINNTVPYGLYQLTALLVKEDFIDLDSIYSHLLPKDDEAFEHYNAFSVKCLDEANKIGKINLAATGKDLMDDEKQGDVTVDLFTALDMENEAVGERSPELENSQTLGLLTGFLLVDDWYHAHILFDRLSPLNPVEHMQICNGLFRLIERSISSAYVLLRQTQLQSSGTPVGASGDLLETSNSSINRPFIDLPKELFEMLSSAGPYLHRNTLLLQKVCRVLRGYYLSALVTSGGVLHSETGVGGTRTPRMHLKEARLRIEEALGTCLLPSLQLIPANPAVGQEIWDVLSLLPYEVRYRLYGEWEKDDEHIPMVLSAKQTAKVEKCNFGIYFRLHCPDFCVFGFNLLGFSVSQLDTRRILKRLAKENLKQLGRMVAKLAHANPMTVLRTIVHQIEAYRDMITPVVDAFKYLTQLEYDILEYVVIERLAQGGREKLKDDGLNLSDWLQSLASFWGHLYIGLSGRIIGAGNIWSIGDDSEPLFAWWLADSSVEFPDMPIYSWAMPCAIGVRLHFIKKDMRCILLLHPPYDKWFSSFLKRNSMSQKLWVAESYNDSEVLCKKYPSMELRGLFQYLVNQLKKGNGIELVLLQELIQQMANVQYTENMTEDQLDAMAGSETLRYQATSLGYPKQ
ncbi:hypothetical protein RJ639_028016 [Escallonia herrerae]|uniref:THO complex subunit 2 n=1 Tax=Escallonia herrerae TaxID=1293975 RepID=A0AA89BQV6_9ASTE|nr:hypothetical protein RJ639_028016 [Escallonia herrerae]